MVFKACLLAFLMICPTLMSVGVKTSHTGTENAFSSYIVALTPLIIEYKTPASTDFSATALFWQWQDLQACMRISMPNTIITVVLGQSDWHGLSYFVWANKTVFLANNANESDYRALLYQFLSYSTDKQAAIRLKNSIILEKELDNYCLDDIRLIKPDNIVE